MKESFWKHRSFVCVQNSAWRNFVHSNCVDSISSIKCLVFSRTANPTHSLPRGYFLHYFLSVLRTITRRSIFRFPVTWPKFRSKMKTRKHHTAFIRDQSFRSLLFPFNCLHKFHGSRFFDFAHVIQKFNVITRVDFRFPLQCLSVGQCFPDNL